MSRFLSIMVKEAIGPGHALADANPVPQIFRQTPSPVKGVPLATPAGAVQPTGSPARTIPKPQ